MRFVPSGPAGAVLLSVALAAATGGCSTANLRDPLALFKAAPGAGAAVDTPVRGDSASSGGALPGSYGLFLEEHREGRIYAFDDLKTYRSYLASGKPSYPFIRVWGGPKSETIAFARGEADRDKNSGIPILDLYDGRAMPAQDFHGEIHRDGRYYVFDSWSRMNAFRTQRRVDHAFTDERGGPRGEPVVYALAPGVEGRPEAAMARFRHIHAPELTPAPDALPAVALGAPGAAPPLARSGPAKPGARAAVPAKADSAAAGRAAGKAATKTAATGAKGTTGTVKPAPGKPPVAQTAKTAAKKAKKSG